MSKPSPKILPVDEVAAIREQLRERGLQVVQCHGCFDLVHPGHIRYLKFAKDLGDVLIVSVSADDVIDKGENRPYIAEELRLENLAVLEFVDYVCLDHNEWAGPVLEHLRPDIYVKGKEYESKGDPRFARERALVESYGGRVVFSSGDVIYSSTSILSQFRERFPLEKERIELYCRRHGITRSLVTNLLRDFAGKRLLVIGDPVLDHYIHCDALGIASESPVLTVTPIREEWFAGAGALIAAQIVELGGSAGFLTGLAPSPETTRFRMALEEVGVDLLECKDADRQAAVKSRYLVEDRKVFKVDGLRPVPSSSRSAASIAGELESRLKDYDALIVTDFGYGLFTQPLIDSIEQLTTTANKPYYIDVSHTRRASILRFKRPRISAPTEQELRFAFADNESGLSNLASRFFRETEAEHLLLTMGARGVLSFRRPDRPMQRLKTEFLPAFESAAIDPVGAGDVFLAGVALADVCGASPHVAAYLGSALAALHVAELGNSVVDSRALHRYLESRPELPE